MYSVTYCDCKWLQLHEWGAYSSAAEADIKSATVAETAVSLGQTLRAHGSIVPSFYRRAGNKQSLLYIGVIAGVISDQD